MQRPSNMEEFAAFASGLTRESGALIMEYFGRDVGVQIKNDQTPVTVADQRAEALLRQRIGSRYPEHQILGEEEGLSGPGDAEYRWVLDPIDGTKSFIRGVPLFGTLIALLHEDQPVLGLIHLPAMGQLLTGARGMPTTCNGTPVHVSGTRDLASATVLFTSPGELYRRGYGAALQELTKRVGLVRSWGDCFGHFLVATGQADAMFDPILNIWDVAALKPCIEGAGGKLTDRQGDPTGLGDSALSSNGHLHREVLQIMQPA